MQATAKGVGVAKIHGDHVLAQLVELFHLPGLGRLDTDGLGVQNQHVHGKPGRGIAQRRRRVVRRLGGIDDFPAVLFEHPALVFRQATLWVVQDQSRSDRREGRVDVDGVGVARKVHRVDAVIGEVTAQPLDALLVRREAVLHHQILAEAQHVGSVEQGFFLGCDKEFFGGPFQTLCLADFVGQVIRVVVGIRQARLGCGFMAEIRVLVEIALHQRAIAEVLEPATAIGHGRFQNFVADRQQHIARRHAAKLAVGVEIRSRCGLGEIDRRGPVDRHAVALKLFGELVQQFICTVDRFLRTPAPLAAHVAVFRHLGIQCRFGRGDVAIVGAPDDNVLQRIPLVPRVHNGFRHATLQFVRGCMKDIR